MCYNYKFSISKTVTLAFLMSKIQLTTFFNFYVRIYRAAIQENTVNLKNVFSPQKLLNKQYFVIK